MTDSERRTVKLIAWTVGIIVAIVLVVILAPFKTIGATERGVVLRFGEVNRTMQPGLNFKMPLVERVRVLDVATQKEEVTAAAASKDLQSVSSVIAVNYNLQPDKVAEIWSQFAGNEKEVVIAPAVQESVKAATAKYTAEELITKRELVKQDIITTLKERLSQSNISVSNVSIVNFDFSPAFNESVEAKVKAVQDALAAENKLKQVEFEARQQIETAKATAQSIRLQSEAASNQKYVELKQLEVQLEFAKKWNGVLPANLYGSAPIPFLQIGQ
jgi:prohibitin 2